MAADGSAFFSAYSFDPNPVMAQCNMWDTALFMAIAAVVVQCGKRWLPV